MLRYNKPKPAGRISRFFFPGRCPGCGLLFEGGFCEECAATCVPDEKGFPDKPNYFALFNSSGAPKYAIYRLKFRYNPRSAVSLGDMLAKAAAERWPDIDISAICYAPQNSKKRRRPYNHAERLAKEVGRRLSIPVRGYLKRTRKSRLQHTLSASERRENVSGLYKVSGKIGGNVIFIDDIITSGATAEESVRTLKSAGAENVYVLSVLRAAEKNKAL